jgi:DNA-binding MarR family transcriptional regulator
MIDAHLRHVSSTHGIPVRGDYEVLAALRRVSPDGLTPRALAERTMLTTAGMTGRLDRLESEGLVERQTHPSDRRSLIVTITHGGRDRYESVFEASRAAITEGLLGDLDVDWARFASELRKLAEALEGRQRLMA